MKEFFDLLPLLVGWFGVDVAAFKIGLVGGTLSLTYEKKPTTRQALATILAGGFGSGYLSPALAGFFGGSSQLQNALAFLLGLAVMRIIPPLLAFVERVAKNPREHLKIPFIKDGKQSDDER